MFSEETYGDEEGGRGIYSVLLLPNALARFVETVAHDDAHPKEVVGGAETTGGEISLWRIPSAGNFRSVVELVAWFSRCLGTLY
jgi:hypothetical protein